MNKLSTYIIVTPDKGLLYGCNSSSEDRAWDWYINNVAAPGYDRAFHEARGVRAVEFTAKVT